MFKIIRALVIAVVIAVSLLGSASFASADTGRGLPKTPTVQPLDITWE